jgi:hypothetical protein
LLFPLVEQALVDYLVVVQARLVPVARLVVLQAVVDS